MILFSTRISLIIIILLIANCLKAQSYKAEYSYDNKGNRVLTNVVYLSKTIDPKTLEEKVDFESELESIITIRVYPNPTKGILLIEITSKSIEQIQSPPSGIVLFDVSGKKLWETNSLKSMNTIDLSTFPNGIYMVQLRLAEKVKTYKVIKN
jgi:hypothetical protein